MTEKRYYQKNYEESYYIFDSNTISEDEFEERVQYEGYDVFGDSLTGSEIIDLLNENEQLKQENQSWLKTASHVDNIAHKDKDYAKRMHKENEELKYLLELISRATSFTKEESVKEILRHEIKGIDTAAEDSAMAWNDYCVLSNFFKKQYGEHWDNE